MDIVFLIVGVVLGFVIAFLYLKSKQSSGHDTSGLDSQILLLKKDLDFAISERDKASKENTVLESENKKYSSDLISVIKELEFANSEKSRLSNEKDELNVEFKRISADLIAANSRIESSIEKFKAQDDKQKAMKEELEVVHKKYSLEFENIANKILDDKTQKFTEQNKTNLDLILNPLKENIKRFEEQVEKSYKIESNERNGLKAEIKTLVEKSQSISEQAHNLATALKGDNKMQGNWGEHILENIFERSGLIKDKEYKREQSTTNEQGGRDRPDFIVYLPDDKHVIVDSKVSLVAYEKSVNAADDTEREKYVKEHILSIKGHIKSLSEKNYQNISGLNTPDFVLLFIPIESSFSIAVKADADLFNFAWDKKIVIVSPSTLLATLLTIASIWKQERQTKNAIEIARQSGALLDKFTGFLEDMDKIGKALTSSRTSYDVAMSKLKEGPGNLIKKAHDIQKLGAKTTKTLPTHFEDEENTTDSIED